MLASCRSIGVDPFPEVTVELGPGARVIAQTSDAFFDGLAGELLREPPDLVFIDGQHLFEYALRDFMHSERFAAPTTLIAIDDIFPNHPRQAARERTTQVWMGDVWRLHACLAELRPDLLLLPVDASPADLLLVAGLDPDSSILWERYPALVRGVAEAASERPPAHVLARRGALAGDSPIIRRLFMLLREHRQRGAPRAETAASIAELRAAVAPGRDRSDYGSTT